MKRLKQKLRFKLRQKMILLGFLSVLCFTLSMSMSSSSWAGPQEDLGKFQKLVMEITSTATAPQAISANIAALGDLPYAEVDYYLTNFLTNELKKPTPNTFYISAGVTALGKISAQGTKAFLGSFSQQLSSSATIKSNVIPMVTSNIQKVIAAIGSEKSLPSLPTVATTAPAPTVVTAPASAPSSSAAAITTPSTVAPPIPNSGVLVTDLMTLATQGDPEAVIMLKILGTNPNAVMSDKYKNEVKTGTLRAIPYREKEVDRGIEVLARIKGSTPVYIGEAGVGKTTVVQRMAQRMAENKLPGDPTYDFLKDSWLLETTAGKISSLAKSDQPQSQALAIEQFFEAVKATQEKLGKKIIVYIDECHTLAPAQWEAMKRFMEMEDGPKIVLSSTAKEFEMAISNNDALRRRVVPILVDEFDNAKTKAVLNDFWLPVIHQKYNVKIDDSALDAAIQNARDLYPDIKRPDAPFKVLQAVATRLTQEQGKKGRSSKIDIDAKAIYKYVSDETGIPFSPYDHTEFFKYIADKKSELKHDIIGQDPLVEGVVDSFKSVMLSAGSKKGYSSSLILGPTGVGKTYIAEKLAEKLYGNQSRMLVVDCTRYGGSTEDGMNMNDLLGAPPGIVSSDKQRGSLLEFLDGPGKHGGVIVFNEAEKAGPAFWKRLMEFFDKGEIVGNDSRTRRLNKHMILLTSNKGSVNIFPRGKKWNRQDISAVLNSYSGGTGQKKLKDIFTTDSDRKFNETAKVLPPEIVNRIDNYFLAAPLLNEDASKIARLEVDKAVKRMHDQFQIDFNITDDVVNTIALSSFTPEDGARQIAGQIRIYIDRALEKAIQATDAKASHKVSMQLVKDATNPYATPKITIANTTNSKQSSIDAPSEIQSNRYMDSEFRERMKMLEPVMKKQVIGQDDMVQESAKAIRSHYVNPDRKNPVSLMLIGRTGTGKTEMAKAIANAVFAPMDQLKGTGALNGAISDQIEVISMGNITDEHMANNIFGSPKGHVGSDEDAEFEKALKRLPNGGVIVFDELSNVGGGNRSNKAAVLKRFYEILDEGKWSSPRGNEYDLSKYIFVATGNDGENLFLDGSSDDMLLATWNRYKDRESTLNILTESGFPEALGGRFSGVFLTKPLLSTERAAIANKLLQGEATALAKSYGFTLDADPDFFTKMEAAFFNHKQGARSLKEFIQTQVSDLLSNVISAKIADPKSLVGATVKLSMSDNMPKLPFVERSFKRQANLNAKLFLKGTTTADTDISRDITALTRGKILVPKHVGETTAYHETGHALANDPDSSGKEVEFITVLPAGQALGYTRYGAVPNYYPSETIATTLNHIASAVAGSVGERLATGKTSAGWSSDLQSARTIATDAVVKFGLAPGLESIPMVDGKPMLGGPTAAAVSKKVEELLNLGLIYAKEYLLAHWPLEQAIVDKLMKKGSISGEDFSKLVDRFARGKKFKKIPMDLKPKFPNVVVTTTKDAMEIEELKSKLLEILQDENVAMTSQMLAALQNGPTATAVACK
ncbi:MAG: AAA family ATPase [Oligoflexia bacterium]|nr:AAA family ATPase [Oligoflexia bacterium]